MGSNRLNRTSTRDDLPAPGGPETTQATGRPAPMCMALDCRKASRLAAPGLGPRGTSRRRAQPSLEEIPQPEPSAGEVLVDAEAASVNGFDLSVAAGYVWDMLPHE